MTAVAAALLWSWTALRSRKPESKYFLVKHICLLVSMDIPIVVVVVVVVATSVYQDPGPYTLRVFAIYYYSGSICPLSLLVLLLLPLFLLLQKREYFCYPSRFGGIANATRWYPGIGVKKLLGPAGITFAACGTGVSCEKDEYSAWTPIFGDYSQITTSRRINPNRQREMQAVS